MGSETQGTVHQYVASASEADRSGKIHPDVRNQIMHRWHACCAAGQTSYVTSSSPSIDLSLVLRLIVDRKTSSELRHIAFRTARLCFSHIKQRPTRPR